MAADPRNVAGHRARYERLRAALPASEVGTAYVGGGDPLMTGWRELEVLRRFRPLDGASVVDIGCGVGRLTRHLLAEPLAGYLGTDVVPEVLATARELAADDPRFLFAEADGCRIPAPDRSADAVVAFSVVTHLLDEEVFEYFEEMRRVLRPGGVALVSFLDVARQRALFLAHARRHREGLGDLTRFTARQTLVVTARGAGFERPEFVAPDTDLAASGAVSALVPSPPPTFRLGQALCVLCG